MFSNTIHATAVHNHRISTNIQTHHQGNNLATAKSTLPSQSMYKHTKTLTLILKNHDVPLAFLHLELSSSGDDQFVSVLYTPRFKQIHKVQKAHKNMFLAVAIFAAQNTHNYCTINLASK